MKNIYFPSTGKMIEAITFNNGITDYFFSEDLHRVNLYCDRYGLNPLDYNTFEDVYFNLKNKSI
jgi:hypothetical protein